MQNCSAPFLDGWHAHRLQVPKNPSSTEEQNPYSEEKQPYSHHQYIAGWVARYSAIKHDQPLTHDETMFD